MSVEITISKVQDLLEQAQALLADIEVTEVNESALDAATLHIDYALDDISSL
jgi:hypothetical protein